MKVSKLKKKLILLFVSVAGFLSFFSGTGALALSAEEVAKEVMLNQLKKCYAPLSMSTEINLVSYREGANAEESFRNYVLNGGGTGQLLYVPTLIGSGVAAKAGDGTRVTCAELFLGDSSKGLSGIFSQTGKALPNPTSSNLSSELNKIGYTAFEAGNSTQKCIKGSYKENGMSATKDAGSVCWEESVTQNKAAFINMAIVNPGNGASMGAVWNNAPMAMGSNYNRGEITFTDPNGETCKLGDGSGYNVTAVNKVGDIDGAAGSTCSTSGYTVTASVESSIIAGSDVGTTKIQNFSIAYSTARTNFGGSGALKEFSNEDKYSLYYAYLQNVYGMTPFEGTCKTRAQVAALGGPVQSDGSYWVYENGAYYKKDFPAANKSLGVSVFVNDKNFLTGWNSLDRVVESIYNFNLPESGTCEEQETDDSSSSGGSGSFTPSLDDGIVDCNGFKNVGAMQWILCPVTNNAQYTANQLDTIVEDMLELDTDTYANDTVKQVWGQIRNIANILLIVFFLVIIFSQLTGYGIDNYGIKKMLPRLIVMAILLNLSLYICQIAIDLSNIFGVGLRNMFGGIGQSVGGSDGLSFIGTMFMTAFASAGGVATGVGAGAAIFGLGAPLTVAILIAGLVALLVIIVAIVTLFIMLGIRRIIVIVCIVLSPLAFAAYILPNTQNLFKKWWELFKAAIIIFPICGAMSGISYLLKSIARGSGTGIGVAGALVMMVLPYVGFFLIPMLLKNAISALGKVGGALTALGGTVKGGAQTLGRTAMKTAQGTETYKNWQNEGVRRRQNESADRTIRRLEELRDRNGELSEADTRRLARAHETKRRLSNEDAAARTVLAEREYAGVSQDKMLADWNEAFDSGDTDRMDALTNVLVARGGAGAVNQMAKSIAARDGVDANGNEIGIFNNNGGFRNDAMEKSFTAFQANMMQNKALSNAMQNKASDVYQMVTSGGYVNKDANGNAIVDANGNPSTKRQNLSAHTANNGMATQIKDWATQSSATLERAAASGMLTPKMMQDILNSNDPSVQSGINSDADKRRVLEAGASGMLASRSNPTPNIPGGGQMSWGNKADVDRAAASYRTQAEINELHGQALDENREWDRREAERQNQRNRDNDIRRMADSVERMANRERNEQNGSNNSGQGFEDGAGI